MTPSNAWLVFIGFYAVALVVLLVVIFAALGMTIVGRFRERRQSAEKFNRYWERT